MKLSVATRQKDSEAWWDSSFNQRRLTVFTSLFLLPRSANCSSAVSQSIVGQPILTQTQVTLDEKAEWGSGSRGHGRISMKLLQDLMTPLLAGVMEELNRRRQVLLPQEVRASRPDATIVFI